MDVGLDEIIKKKFKRRTPGGRRPNRSAPGNRGRGRRPDNRIGKKFSAPMASVGAVKKTPMIDARTKIIARKRKTLKDAREKLNSLHRQKDARLKLSTNSLRLGSRLGAVGAAVLGDMVPRRTINNSTRVPRPVMDSFSYERSDLSRRERVYRTIENDDDVEMWDPSALPQLEVRLTRPSPAPQYRPSVREMRSSREESWIKPLSSIPIVRMNEESVKSRLEPLRQEEGFRIVVSNLQPTVTHEDIKELFEDIGPLLRSRVVRPGTAEVVYRDLKDAVTAVDTYHNRQLDGQPMKCLLVKPSTTSKGIVGTKGSVVPDLSTIHKALFMK